MHFHHFVNGVWHTLRTRTDVRLTIADGALSVGLALVLMACLYKRRSRPPWWVSWRILWYVQGTMYATMTLVADVVWVQARWVFGDTADGTMACPWPNERMICWITVQSICVGLLLAALLWPRRSATTPVLMYEVMVGHSLARGCLVLLFILERGVCVADGSALFAAIFGVLTASCIGCHMGGWRRSIEGHPAFGRPSNTHKGHGGDRPFDDDDDILMDMVVDQRNGDLEDGAPILAEDVSSTMRMGATTDESSDEDGPSETLIRRRLKKERSREGDHHREDSDATTNSSDDDDEAELSEITVHFDKAPVWDQDDGAMKKATAMDLRGGKVLFHDMGDDDDDEEEDPSTTATDARVPHWRTGPREGDDSGNAGAPSSSPYVANPRDWAPRS